MFAKISSHQDYIDFKHFFLQYLIKTRGNPLREEPTDRKKQATPNPAEPQS